MMNGRVVLKVDTQKSYPDCEEGVVAILSDSEIRNGVYSF